MRTRKTSGEGALGAGCLFFVPVGGIFEGGGEDWCGWWWVLWEAWCGKHSGVSGMQTGMWCLGETRQQAGGVGGVGSFQATTQVIASPSHMHCCHCCCCPLLSLLLCPPPQGTSYPSL